MANSDAHVLTLMQQLSAPRSLPACGAAAYATNEFIDEFAKACGNSYLVNFRSCLRHLHQFFGGDDALRLASAPDFKRFLDHECSRFSKNGRTEDYRKQGASLGARLQLYFQYQGVSPTHGWGRDDLSLCYRYREILKEAGYANWSLRERVGQFAHAVVWCRLNHVEPTTLDESTADSFADHFCLCGVRTKIGSAEGNWSDTRRRAALHLARMVRGEDPLMVNGTCKAARRRRTGSLPPTFEEFLDHGVRVNGLRLSTIKRYRIDLLKFCHELGENAELYTASHLRQVFATATKGLTKATATKVLSGIRAYLNYRAARGDCPEGLHEVLIRPHAYVAPVCKVRPGFAELRSQVAQCNSDTPRSCRDRAILLLLHELGLRGDEVRNLRLEDIDLERVTLIISSKTGRHAIMPLTSDAGHALLDYIEHARPISRSKYVFLRAVPPYVKLAPSGVSHIARKWLAENGLAGGGSHDFRHALGTALLQNPNGSLQQAATVLRHANVDTTRIYAAVSTSMMADVIQPWPGASR